MLAMETPHTIIDATGKPLGRLATRIAVLLRGKDKPGFVAHDDKGGTVVVRNAGLMKLSGRKLSQKQYYRHSGYPGGIKATPLSKLFAEKPQEVLRKAVMGMLPRTRLRSRQIARLRFE
ncbi:MAG: 50S ribosomal protein L13 [Candidatus Wildermuthbacteria bacterium]|nr:50S ribosomal protein L13 [Candidatus Wildermuthbacteria bacterium]MBI2121081.1 50S ribosomal protein L13 [Candidatus Wildermuthbacteria bacterium]